MDPLDRTDAANQETCNHTLKMKFIQHGVQYRHGTHLGIDKPQMSMFNTATLSLHRPLFRINLLL